MLELSEVGFCNSSGLRLLVEADQSARAHGAAFRLAAVSQAVFRVFEIAGALEVFGLFADVDAALKD